MLNSASMQNDSRQGAFFFIQLALEAIILFPGIEGISMTGLPTSPKSIFVGRVYRRQRSASAITPEATTTITTTVASASTEARVSYQLFQSSSIALAPIERAPTSDKMHSVERTCLHAQEYNATFRRVRFDRAAT
jgi:hypothetical protein